MDESSCWISRILIDKPDWNDMSMLAPCYILGTDNDLIPVYIGTPDIEKKENISEFYGIYIKSSDYKKIDHEKIYVLIHDPIPDVTDIVRFVQENHKDNIDLPGKDGHHIHITRGYPDKI
jgi:hypothetical protein